jgi:hypothetical protein
MLQTTRYSIPYPQDGDTPDVPRDIKAAVEVIDEAIWNADNIRPAVPGQKVAYGFIDARTVGPVQAGGAYTWKITVPEISNIINAVATFKHYSLTDLGWLPPGSLQDVGKFEVNVTVGYQPSDDPDTLRVTAYFPIAFTPDSRGGEGVNYWVIGT